ncbi:uncharacterized protein K460DRAFT_369804 [Cucurbitaria berberidis CBS 394.84]|uniref:Uncharacterized protein n=1 Tax=Cucurbitaria berberidis CBS 394.84 TaxID=1168544 RepID=A0A9P4L4A2_9PLEO|nr:uncharacterized protein K460DRAFT_369804 [Cucurbitaria berberidis CBS 394.84]KAF1841791.1 hypothetical protein K460DRAFT_369804 [Cucurbitaria berberidis CBS 394.84]
MAATPRPIKCKSCDRVLANVSPKGLVATDATEITGCDTCQRFSALYDAMQAADEEYAPLVQKGDKHHGKQFAVAKVRKTHMDFDNWLIGVEAPVKQSAEQQDGSKEEWQEAEVNTQDRAGHHQGIKRTRSYSPTHQQSEMDSKRSEALEDQQIQQQQQQTVSIPHRPSPKRSYSTTSLPERKRLKFSNSVEFRDDYRNYLTLGRSSDEYMPGRYAPPEEGYLDTSGADQSFPKFTGLKKVRGAWVEVKEKDEKIGGQGVKITGELRGLGIADDAPPQEHGNDTENGQRREDDAELDSRSARLARRTGRSSHVGTAQKDGNAARSTTGRSTVARRGPSDSLKRASNEAQDTASDAAADQPTTEEKRKCDLPTGIAATVTQRLRESEQTLGGDTGEDQQA